MTRAGPGVTATGLLILALVIAGCGTSASPSPSPASPDSSTTPAPRPTPWTGNAVLGIEGLALADTEIRQAMTDFNAGVQAGDPARMLEAARGLSSVDVLLHNVERIEPFPPMGAFAAAYREAITLMASAAKELAAAIEAGDGGATTAASRKLIDSFTKYVALQSPLADWVVQLPDQKRMLVR